VECLIGMSGHAGSMIFIIALINFSVAA